MLDHSAPPVPPLREFLPKQFGHTFAPVGLCIYCGTDQYLSDEHIIPLGLGGRFILPKASCRTCSRITSEFERTCLRRMYGPLRLLYELPSRRVNDRPETLNLKVKWTPEAEWTYVPVPADRYPFLVTFPYFGMPGALTGNVPETASGPVTSRLWIRGASPEHDFMQLLAALTKDLGVYAVMPESVAEIPAFCRLLAKIAHAYAIAEFGYSNVRSDLSPFIVAGALDHCLHHIGSAAKDDSPTDELHEMDVRERLRDSLLVVKIRLLAKLGTPTYYVVVGSRTPNAS